VRPGQLAIGIAVDVVLAIAWIGLVSQRRWRLAWLFSAYVPVVVICGLLQAIAPAQFFVAGFWMAKQVAYDILKLGIALELAWRTFRVFPGAQASVRRVVLAILGLTTVAVMAAPTDSSASELFLVASGQLHPRVLNGTIWLMAATLALAHWYRVPVHPFRAALLTSFAAYLTLFGTLLRLEGLYGWAAQPYLNAIDPPAYLLLACWWAYLAWRTESPTTRAYAETIRRLELRTASCG
jgi:hypothetical protein